MVAPATTTARPARAVPVAAVVATLCLCGTVVALQQTLVVPLLPDFPEILGTSTDNASWLVTSTLLVGAVATPIVSRLADMIGKRRMMVLCLLVTVTGSVVAALGPSFALVVTGRALQGFGAALIPVGISILRDELPREKVPSAVALMSATLGIGGGIGLPMSGLIYEHLGWHAIFWSSAAIGVVLIVAVLAIVPESAIRTRGRFDYVGAVLLSIALTSLLLAISKGGTWGWTSEPTLGLFLVALVVLVVWVPFELRVSQPMVDIRTSTRRPVLLTNIASVLVGFAMFGNLLATTQQLQLPVSTGFGFGLTVVVAGLYMLPSSLAMVVFAPVSAGITRRSGAKTTLVIGCVLLAAGYVARVFLTGAIWQVVLGATIVSIGTAIGYAAMPTLIMRAVPITETASANGLNTLLRAIGTSTASAAVAAVLSSVTIDVDGVALPSLEAFKDIFWIAAAASIAAAAVALALPSSQRAAAIGSGRGGGPRTGEGCSGGRGQGRGARARGRRAGRRAPRRPASDPARRGHRAQHRRRTGRLEPGRQRGQLLGGASRPRPVRRRVLGRGVGSPLGDPRLHRPGHPAAHPAHRAALAVRHDHDVGPTARAGARVRHQAHRRVGRDRARRRGGPLRDTTAADRPLHPHGRGSPCAVGAVPPGPGHRRSVQQD